MVQHKVAVKMVVLNNNLLGMVREYQHYSYKDNYTVVDLSGSPSLEKIAEAYGIGFLRVENMEQAEESIDRFLQTEGSVLMECLIDPMDLVR